VAVVALAAGIGLWAVVVDAGLGVLPLVAALSLIACASERTVRRGLFLLAVIAAVVAWVVATGDHVTPALSLFTIAYPYIVFASVWAWDVVTRLDAARATQADLAVARERLRFAADLHDIQGHSLQVIALKAELAERLLGAKPEAAAVQISEVRVEAADALGRTRELARGYRATGIEDELDNARDVLTVAGFECTTEVEDLPRGDTTRSLFGRALREATTNVLRHAAAGPVRIGLEHRRAVGRRGGVWQLRVVNRVAVSPGAGGSGPRDGAGLAGLTERAERLGGRVDTKVRDVAGTGEFILTVEVPVGSGPEGRE
jgi:two-component system sensor histidine kinase DesK